MITVVARNILQRHEQLFCKKLKYQPGMNLLGQAMNAACEVLGHDAALNSLNTHPLQNLGEPADKQKDIKSWHVPFIPGPECFRQNISYLIRSGLPSSLPRCSRPLVQAKMLAMGLVLVGLP